MTYPGLDIAVKYLFLTALIILGAKIARVTLQRFRIKKQQRHINQRSNLFRTLYSGVNGFNISKDFRTAQKMDDKEFIYGEIMFTPFAELLQRARPKPGDIVYDLGCGSGKAVFAFALLYENLSIHGVELLEPLYQCCLDRLQHYSTMPGIYQSTSIEFHLANILDCDFSQANVIFINAVCFHRKTWAQILAKFDELPIGARIIITTKNIVSKKFKLTYSGFVLMSWGQNSVFIYEKIL